jgi:Ca-activated chloride channel family protein
MVFVVDVSGSMNTGNRIVLVIETLKHIINRANYSDQIGIVAYNETAEIILESTSGRYKDKLLAAVDRLYPYGPTNVQAGLHLGYQMASRHFDPKKSNRVLLFSDGVANVGQTDADNLLNETRKYAQKGITLTSIGVGMGNYNDVLMEKLGDKGNGFYAYIDSFDEARRVFEGNLAGALQVIARDVKIQVEFDPEMVQSYRLLGYENRAVADYNFRNDKVDGGEVGPGHAATALYEINLKNFRRTWHNDALQSESIGRVFIRYKNPQSGAVEEISKPIATSTLKHQFSRATPQFKLAAASAEFAEIMRDSYWAKNSNLDEVLRLANEVYHQTSEEEVQEFVNLIAKARHLRNIDSDYFSRE